MVTKASQAALTVYNLGLFCLDRLIKINLLKCLVFSALAGMSLSIAAETIGSTEFGIRIASEAESDMTSVERVFTYTEIDPEPGYNSETLPPEDWPTEGSLALQDLSLAYLKGAPATLNNVSVCVAAKEKVGVAGRTGAGKSSLVSALFRMPEPEGKVRHVINVIFGTYKNLFFAQILGRNSFCQYGEQG